jgi:hypothetical protein
MAFIATFCAVATAFADPRVERDARALQKKAIEEDSLNVNYAAAVKKLQSAVNKCGADRCGAQLKATLLRDLGAMQLLAGNVEAGRGNFAQAVRLDSSLDLDPSYKNAMLEGIWSDVKSRGAAAPAAGGGGGGGGGAPASGDFTHTPPSETLVRTPLALYVEYSGGDQLGRVIVKYKIPHGSDWKTLRLKKMGDGFGGLIPCGDLAVQGSLQYFIQGFDAQNQAVAMSGSRTAPFTVEVKADIGGAEVPSLPGKPPPTQCKDKANETECPPDFPGCAVTKKDVGDDCDKAAQCSSGSCVAGKCAETEKKGAGDSCETDDECTGGTCSDGKCSDKKSSGDYCENDNQCASGSCEDSKCTEAASYRLRRFWFGLGGQVDFYVLPSATDVCLRNSQGLNLNTAGYTCIDPTTSEQFPVPASVNNTITRGAGTPNSGGGFALGNIRADLTFDYALNKSMLAGIRAGWTFRTDPAKGAPGAAFPGVHLEARFTMLFGGNLMQGGIAGMVFGGLGLGEFDAFVPVTVQLTAPPPSNTCTSQATNPNVPGQTRCAENAWLAAGPFYATVGGGVRFRVGNALAIPIALKLEGAFGGRAGFLFGLAPELGLQFGF